MACVCQICSARYLLKLQATYVCIQADEQLLLEDSNGWTVLSHAVSVPQPATEHPVVFLFAAQTAEMQAKMLKAVDSTGHNPFMRAAVYGTMSSSSMGVIAVTSLSPEVVASVCKQATYASGDNLFHLMAAHCEPTAVDDCLRIIGHITKVPGALSAVGVFNAAAETPLFIAVKVSTCARSCIMLTVLPYLMLPFETLAAKICSCRYDPRLPCAMLHISPTWKPGLLTHLNQLHDAEA